MPPKITHLLTPAQLRTICQQTLDLLITDIQAEPTTDPTPRLRVYYMEPNTAQNQQQLTNIRNWQQDFYHFQHFGENRYQQLYEIGVNYARRGRSLFAAFLAAPIWLAPFTPDATGQIPSDAPPPSQHPHKKEAIICWGKTIDKTGHTIIIPITRDPRGAAILGPPRHRTADQASLIAELFRGYAVAYLQILQKNNPALSSLFHFVHPN